MKTLDDTQCKCPICLQECKQIFIETKWEYSIYRCSNCSVEYAIPLKTTSYVNDPRIKIGYRRRLELIGNYIGWAQREFLKLNIIKPGAKVLEIGCGTGDFIHLLKSRGIEAVGVDLDSDAVNSGKKYWGDDLPLFTMSAKEYFMLHEKSIFQIVCLFAVLEHLEDIHAIFNDISSMLAVNGYIVIEVPNNDSYLTTLYRHLTRYIDYPPQHLTRWNRKAIARFLEIYNFQVIYYKISRPSFSDIISDVIKLFTPSFVPTPVMKKIISFSSLLFKPLDILMSCFIKEGRDLLVVAQQK